MEDRRDISIAIQPVADSGGERYYRPAKNDALDMVKCPAIIKVSNSFQNAFHSVILFYRSFYGHSTKVEKNQAK